MTKPKKSKKIKGNQKETPIQRKAFEYYLSLGGERSIRKVAEKFGYSPQTVYTWSSRFKWADRIYQHELREAERLRGLTERLSREAEEHLIEKQTNLLRLVDISVQKYFSDVERDPGAAVPIESTSDIRNIVEITRLLLDRPTEITRQESVVVDRTRELLERLKESTKAKKEEPEG